MYNRTRSRGFSRNRTNNRRGRSSRGSRIDVGLFSQRAVTPETEIAYEPKNTFDSFGFEKILADNIRNRGYKLPTPIQDETISLALGGKDIIGIAETGTGKTAAFLLPLINKIYNDPHARVLIIAPTRELAAQIESELKLFVDNMHIYSAQLIGGASFGFQVKALRRNPQFIIGTPGRIKDHLNRKTLRINNVNSVVLDEADRMVEMGFINDIRHILGLLPRERQSLFFSATVTPKVGELIATFMNNPQTISVKKQDTSRNVEQSVVYYTDSYERLSRLFSMLGEKNYEKVLIFGRTKHGVEKLSDALIERGISAVSIHGNKNQSQRSRALADFKQNRASVMVATDVAARGLDIPNVSHVINFEVPENYDDYVHRIGRTGRAGNRGIALTFVQGYGDRRQ